MVFTFLPQNAFGFWPIWTTMAGFSAISLAWFPCWVCSRGEYLYLQEATRAPFNPRFRLLPRLTTGHLLIAVAMMAVLFAMGAAESRMRWNTYYAIKTDRYRGLAELYAHYENIERRGGSAGQAKRIAFYTRLKEKYQQAAKHPWEKVVPDPPPP
jgi:hypothetical protein